MVNKADYKLKIQKGFLCNVEILVLSNLKTS